MTETSFKNVSTEKTKTFFDSSLISWIGGKEFSVKLKMIDGTIERKLSPEQKLYKDKDGNNILELAVNSLEEIARWLAGRGDEITVLEPLELKKRIAEISGKTYLNHK